MAPFWSDVDTTVNGTVYWEVHSDLSASMLDDVSELVRSQQPDTQFSGTWMLIATWKDVVSPTLTFVSCCKLKYQTEMIPKSLACRELSKQSLSRMD